MNKQIHKIFMDRIYGSATDRPYDDELECAVDAYIDERGIEKAWNRSGLDEQLLEIYLEVYLSPIKNLTETQRVCYFKDRGVLRELYQERFFFSTLGDSAHRYSADELKSRYNRLRDKCAPLIASGRYDSYIDELLALAACQIDRYLQNGGAAE